MSIKLVNLKILVLIFNFYFVSVLHADTTSNYYCKMQKNYNPTIRGDGNLIYYVPFEFVMKKEQNKLSIKYKVNEKNKIMVLKKYREIINDSILEVDYINFENKNIGSGLYNVLFAKSHNGKKIEVRITYLPHIVTTMGVGFYDCKNVDF